MSRPWDLVLYGATGFTGRQLARRVAERAPAGLRWAIAGRSRDRLLALRDALGLPVGVLVADAEDAPAVRELVGSATVLASTAGPFERYGDPLVAAAVEAGTHWCDITGETPWVRSLIDRFHDRAAEQGTRVVPCCGFDSVPADLATFGVARWIQDEWGQPVRAARAAVSLKGGFNGGTVASVLLLGERHAEELLDPVLLDPPAWRTAAERARQPPEWSPVSWDPDLGRWTGVSMMSVVNTRVVRRSHALLEDAGEGYGRAFTFEERMESRSRWSLLASNAGRHLGWPLIHTAPGRALLRRLAPAPGEGPSEQVIEGGFFRCRVLGLAEDGRKALGVLEGQGDPANRCTVNMLAECALALTLDRDRLPARAGVLTPATAFGELLLHRLRDAGFRWEVGPLPSPA